MHVTALELLENNLKNAKSCLDVGSGSGFLTLAFKLLMPENSVSYGVEHIPELV
jgi:ribosomal protein L11 methylase PrmA